MCTYLITKDNMCSPQYSKKMMHRLSANLHDIQPTSKSGFINFCFLFVFLIAHRYNQNGQTTKRGRAQLAENKMQECQHSCYVTVVLQITTCQYDNVIMQLLQSYYVPIVYAFLSLQPAYKKCRLRHGYC